VEVERARLTKRVADKLEAEGKMDEAREMIMELQVETYGSMEVNEKVSFLFVPPNYIFIHNLFQVHYLLHQMRLSIAKQDFTRATIISRKISAKFFERESEEASPLLLSLNYQYLP
jgi:26S proteasome regulatory subunit N5